MADLEFEIPQEVEHRLSDLFLRRGRRGCGEEHEIEVAERRHLAAPGAAEPDQRQAGRLIVYAARHMIEREANDLIVKKGVGLRRRPAAPGLFAQPASNFGAARFQRIAQDRRGLALLPGPGQPVGHGAAIDDRAPMIDVEQRAGHFAVRAGGRSRVRPDAAS